MTTSHTTATVSDTTDDKVTKRRWEFPHTYAIILMILFLVGIATYLIPSGTFQRHEVDGRDIVVPGTFELVEKTYLTPFDFLLAIPAGLIDASTIIFYIFILGGAFGVIRATGAIDAGIGALVERLGKAEQLLIPVLMITFSILGFTTGMSEESIIFVPIGVGIALALGYDIVVGTAMVSLGAASGFIGGMMNPFTVGVAQGIAQLPLFSGMLFRSIVYVFILSAAIWWVMRYAKRVKEDPTRSVLYGRYGQVGTVVDKVEVESFNLRHKLVLFILIAGIATNMYGVFNFDWFLEEMAAMFIFVGVLAGLVGGLGLNGTFTAMIEGFRSVAFGAIIVGFARAILIVMQNSSVLDTVVNAIADTVQHAPPFLTVAIMFLFQAALNFLIPSGSGQAATTMPIMVPLSDLLGIDRQLAVLAFQYGDAITNSIIPTSASLMGYLAVARVPYERWVKFIWPLVAVWLTIALIGLVIGSVVGVSA